MITLLSVEGRVEGHSIIQGLRITHEDYPCYGATIMLDFKELKEPLVAYDQSGSRGRFQGPVGKVIDITIRVLH